MAQFKEFLLTYNKLSQFCFTDCANDFSTKKITDSEDRCAMNCMGVYLKVTQRLSQRVLEMQMQTSGEDQSLLNNVK